jgi:hypothetical protein
MVNDDNEWNAPFVPGLRTTMDGRVALRVQGGPSTLSFYLVRSRGPRRAHPHGPFGRADAGGVTPFEVTSCRPPPSRGCCAWATTPSATPRRSSRCPGERPNPYPCGTDLANDCYDFTVISSISEPSFTLHMWGTPVTVEVASPKTCARPTSCAWSWARPSEGPTISNSPELAEVAVTIDGRLLTGRLGGANRYWTNPNTGEQLTRSYDLVYSVLPDDADPCDVTAWTTSTR